MASVPYAFECDKSAGFVPDPNEQKRVGYITELHGFSLGAPLASDLTVFVPFSRATTFKNLAPAPHSSGLGKLQVVGVLETFQWDGSVGHPLKFDFYMSQQNASQIKAAQQSKLQTTRVDALSWWIIDFDQETRQWYEQCFPNSG